MRSAYRTVDPDDETNKLLAFKQYIFGYGVIHPGVKYAMNNSIIDDSLYSENGQPIEAELGATYKIQYQYKLKGIQVEPLAFGVAVGKAEFNDHNKDSNTVGAKTEAYLDISKGYTSYIQEPNLTIALPEGETSATHSETDFTTVTTYLTVPSDLVIATDDVTPLNDAKYIQIYIRGGGAPDGDEEGTARVTVYIDNVSVTKVNGKAFTFTDENGETTYHYDRIGRVTYDAKADNDEATGLIWLNSSGRPFVLSSYTFEDLNTFEETKLTAVREKTDVAFSVGDADMNGVIADEDIAATRKDLLNTTADSFSKLRADLTNDGKVDILDILTLKKLSKDALSGNATIGGAAISTFKLSTTVTGTAISKLGEICAGNANTISVTVDDTLSNGHYIIEIKGTSVSIKAKTDAVADAAVKTLLSYINAKMAITDVNSFEFIYTGN